MRASIWLFSFSIVCGAVAMLDACVGDDNVTPPQDAASDSTTGDASSGDASPDGADAGPNQCADASGAFIDATAFLAPGGTAHAVIAIPDGHIIVGEYRTAASFGGDAAITSTNGSTADVFAARLKSDGSLVWQVGYGGAGTDWLNAVAVDAATGDVYVAGYSDQYLGAGLFQNKFNFATSIGSQAYGIVAKLNGQTGAVVWSQGFKNGAFSWGCTSIDFDSGHLVASCGMGTTQAYVAGDGGTGTVTANENTAASVYGLDPATGQALWARALTTSETDAGTTTTVNTVDVTTNNIVVAGTFGGATLSDTPSHAVNIPHVGTQPNGSQYNGFVVELAVGNGAPAWGKGFGDNSGAGTVVTTVAAGSSSTGIVVGGNFTGNIDFGAGPHASVGSTDGFVVLLANKAGAPAWEKYFSGTSTDGVGVVSKEPCGGSVFGLVTDSVLAPIDGVTIPAPQSGGQAALVGKLDSTGKLLWMNGVTPGGSPDNNGINQDSLCVAQDGHTAAVGDFRGTVDLGSGTPSTTPGSGFPYMILYKP